MLQQQYVNLLDSYGILCSWCVMATSAPCLRAFVPSTRKVIADHLVTFGDIRQMQEKNRMLLQVSPGRAITLHKGEPLQKECPARLHECQSQVFHKPLKLCLGSRAIR